jgi:diguanylate cyclase (GGDEF)-like protein
VLVFKERDAANRDRLRAQEELARMAYRDALTGLASRSAFYEALDTAMQEAQTGQRAVAVLFFDLDGFKTVNDLYGHAEGDEVLRNVAARLSVAVREQDLVGRHGGDEFVIVMPDLPPEQAGALAATVAARVAAEFIRPFVTGNRHHRLGITSGFSIYPSDGSSTHELVDSADRAMYGAKQPRPPLPATLAS